VIFVWIHIKVKRITHLCVKMKSKIKKLQILISNRINSKCKINFIRKQLNMSNQLYTSRINSGSSRGGTKHTKSVAIF